MPTSDIKKGPLYVDSTNNRVGIGTSSPAQNLHIESTSASVRQRFVTGTTNQISIDFGDTDSGTVGRITYDHYTDAMAFQTNASERLRIDSSGNVGVGTNSPSTFSPNTTYANVQSIVQADQALTLGSYWQAGVDAYSFIKSNQVGSPTTPIDLRFFGGTSERMRIDSSGQLIISGNGGSATNSLDLSYNGTSGQANIQADSSGGNTYLTFGTSLAGSVSERMRVTTDGNLYIGCVTTPSATVKGSAFINTGFDNELKLATNITSGNYLVIFYNPNGLVGSITVSGSSTAYNTTSDYRLKENVVADWDATTRLKQLNPVRFNFIADPDTTVDGFLAHEVQDVVPEAITGTKDAMMDEEYEVTPAVFDEDGNEVTPAVMGTRSVPDYQGIDQSKLTPLLTKALIEAVEKIEQLETRIAALEAN